jgi:hypothetical protein
MVKRRNSPYVSHDPTRLPGKRPDMSPDLLGPKPLSVPLKQFTILY